MNKLIHYVFVIGLSIITVNGCCFPKQIQMELNFGGTSNCFMNMSKIGNVVVGIFGCPDMNINLTSQNNTFCDGSDCFYPNTLPIDKRFLPVNNNINISLVILNTCGASLGTIQSICIYIPAQAFLQIINNNFAIKSTSSTMNQWVWSCGNNLLQVNNLAFSYIV